MGNQELSFLILPTLGGSGQFWSRLTAIAKSLQAEPRDAGLRGWSFHVRQIGYARPFNIDRGAGDDRNRDAARSEPTHSRPMIWMPRNRSPIHGMWWPFPASTPPCGSHGRISPRVLHELLAPDNRVCRSKTPLPPVAKRGYMVQSPLGGRGGGATAATLFEPFSGEGKAAFQKIRRPPPSAGQILCADIAAQHH